MRTFLVVRARGNRQRRHPRTVRPIARAVHPSPTRASVQSPQRLCRRCRWQPRAAVARGVGPRHEPVVYTGRPVGDLHGAAQRVGRHLSRRDRWVWPRAPHRDPAFDDQAVMSPNGRDIAFVSSRNGQADIWILDIATRQLRNLTNHRGGDYRPAWSPDGAWIAFTSDRGSDGAQAATPGRSGRPFAPQQRTQILVVRADGSGLRQITSGERSAGSATWSKDGSEIAFYEAGPQDWPAISRDFLRATRNIADRGRCGRHWSPAGVDDRAGPQVLAALARRESHCVSVRRCRSGSGHARTRDSRGGTDCVYRRRDFPDWSLYQRELVERWPADRLSPHARCWYGRPRRRRGVGMPHSRPCAPASSRRTRATVAGSYRTQRTRAYFTTASWWRRRTAPIAGSSSTTRSRTPSRRYGRPTANASRLGSGRYNEGTRVGALSHVADDQCGRVWLAAVDRKNAGQPRVSSWSPDGRKISTVDERGGEGSGHHRRRERRHHSASVGGVDRYVPGVVAARRPHPVHQRPRWRLGALYDAHRRQRPEAPDAQSGQRDASWSFDSEWIAFASARGGFKDEMPVGEGGGQGAGDIFVMRADGSDVRRLTDDAFEEATPAFAPNR